MQTMERMQVAQRSAKTRTNLSIIGVTAAGTSSAPDSGLAVVLEYSSLGGAVTALNELGLDNSKKIRQFSHRYSALTTQPPLTDQSSDFIRSSDPPWSQTVGAMRRQLTIGRNRGVRCHDPAQQKNFSQCPVVGHSAECTYAACMIST